MLLVARLAIAFATSVMQYSLAAESPQRGCWGHECSSHVSLVQLPGQLKLTNGTVELLGSRVWTKRESAENLAPDIVIAGIGDSGTRGVRQMMEHLGVAMCHYVSVNDDNLHTFGTNKYITPLLEAAGGSVSQAKGYMSSDVFNESVQTELYGARRTHDCAIQDVGLNENALPADFKWGYKNPNHFFLLPVMDAAFHGKQKVLAVARDPRDLCTACGPNLSYLAPACGLPGRSPPVESLGDGVGPPEDLKTWATMSALSVSVDKLKPHKSCMLFWSHVWKSILQEYFHKDNFLVVRIEDLVIHDPTSNKARETLQHVMRYVNISPGMHEIQRELEVAHQYKDSYMGHHYNMTETYRTNLEDETATYTGIVHDVMRALGYHTHHYGLTEPDHPRVIRL